MEIVIFGPVLTCFGRNGHFTKDETVIGWGAFKTFKTLYETFKARLDLPKPSV